MGILLARKRDETPGIDWGQTAFEWSAVITVVGGVVVLTYLSIVGSAR